MDAALFDQMQTMMGQDHIHEQKEFLEKLVREEWQRRGLAVAQAVDPRLNCETGAAGKSDCKADHGPAGKVTKAAFRRALSGDKGKSGAE